MTRHKNLYLLRLQCAALIGLMLALLLQHQAYADYVGPATVAKADYRLWQGALNTEAGFNQASRASLLQYILVLKEMEKLSDAQMLAAFKIKSINRASVEKWLASEFKLSVRNYAHAAKNCSASDWTCVDGVSNDADLLTKAQDADKKIPDNLQPWRKNIREFTHTYLSEQLRLAALFPKVSSEIDVFNDNEWTGDDVPDLLFYLTFDDGPTKANGSSDETLQMLAKSKKNGVFFVLGERLQERLKSSSAAELTTLFKDQCVASHGWSHKSHAKWEQWQDSILRTETLLNSTFTKDMHLSLFRPPYGQRKDDSETFFKSQSLQVALWNLDSQDWNTQVSVADIENRMVMLILIKRHGVLLFHDVHPKSKSAVPAIIEIFGNAISWGDCHKLGTHH